MAFLPGNCTYRFNQSWTSGGRAMHAKHARFSNDTGLTCDGTSSCNSFVSNNHCGDLPNSTPQRSISGGTYYILLKYQTVGTSSGVDGTTRNFSFFGASITNTQSGTTLSMTLSCPTTGGTACLGSAMRNDSCYQYQIAATHPYLNTSTFTTRTPWTEDCQPCY